MKHHFALPCVPDLTMDPENPACPLRKAASPGPAWRLTCEDGSIAMSEPVRVAVWGLEQMISPEGTIGVHLKPDENADWTRVWTFEA